MRNQAAVMAMTMAMTTIYGIESGQRQARPSTLRKILQALEKTPKLPEI